MKKLISIVIPTYNEEQSIAKTYASLCEQLSLLDDYAFEILLVNDGSSDGTADILRGLHADSFVTKYIEFSRNFGKESATSAGINLAKGDAVIMVDADGQHPVELIKEFIEKWENGYMVVIGVRSKNVGEGFIKKYGSKVFYKLLNSLTDGNTVPGSTDFRLIDRRVADEFNKLTEHGRITRGLIDWIGFKRAYIEFTANKRIGGKASYSIGKLSRLAVHAFVSQSTKPLQVVGFLGIVVMIVSLLAGIILFTQNYLLNDPLHLGVSGTALLAIFLSFLIGVVLACQGLLALYIESIHNETQNRPLFIISDLVTSGDTKKIT